ncbi:hypothetical protein FB567DRAFT_191858 [Paraphoma chrysanthemicola]|uniref:Secreted protein n=1 Tax=Paraphoma chrysanthemicola TaxID=798071 RepID=A0A8K0QXS9_9PLEO|nr:hypothetical protein FB567DRAFT_191858 [Paraphoma chrysanthemicola]
MLFHPRALCTTQLILITIGHFSRPASSIPCDWHCAKPSSSHRSFPHPSAYPVQKPQPAALTHIHRRHSLSAPASPQSPSTQSYSRHQDAQFPCIRLARQGFRSLVQSSSCLSSLFPRQCRCYRGSVVCAPNDYDVVGRRASEKVIG